MYDLPLPLMMAHAKYDALWNDMQTFGTQEMNAADELQRTFWRDQREAAERDVDAASADLEALHAALRAAPVQETES